MASQVKRTEAWAGNKSARASMARAHTAMMDEKFADIIEECAAKTVEYPDMHVPDILQHPNYIYPYIFCVAETTTQCLYHIVNQSFIPDNHNKGFTKIALLNFASYKHPGGMFMEGSIAQEEALCHESILYNVLRLHDKDYYARNRASTNRALYNDNLLYSPDVIFIDPNDNVVKADVITSAAPNASAALKYSKVDEEDIFYALYSRIDHILYAAMDNHVDTLILGAYGCGVFGNDPCMVADIFIHYLCGKYYGQFNAIYFAIPRGKGNDNYDVFTIQINRYTDEDNGMISPESDDPIMNLLKFQEE